VDSPEALGHLVARLLTCGIWVAAGLFKATHFDATVAEMAHHRIPWPAPVLVCVLALELAGSGLLVANLYVWAVALAWIAFMVPASFIYHGFLAGGKIDFVQYVLFWKNVSIAGGLIALILLDPTRPSWLLRA
jgi:putative oxidoreductase